jgi:signal transduction histidine kinase
MPPAPADLLAALDEGVGLLAADGGVVASNDAMHAVLAAAGASGAPVADLRGLGVDADDEARLRAGEAVAVAHAGRHWRLRCRAVAGADVLFAAETTAADRAASALAELARLRLLGRSAGVLVHDFNNMLNAAIGLAATLRPLAADPTDAQLLLDMSAGTQRGAQLLRSVARMLARSPRERVRTPLAAVVAEAVALAEKALLHRGVRPAVAPVPDVHVRSEPTECVQAIWHGLIGLAELAPKSVRVDVDLVDAAIGDGRPRRCARLRLAAAVADDAAAAAIGRMLASDSGLLAALGSPALPSGLAAALFVQRQLGGDLTAVAADGAITLAYLWPALA